MREIMKNVLTVLFILSFICWAGKEVGSLVGHLDSGDSKAGLSALEENLRPNKERLLEIAGKSDTEPYCFIEDTLFRLSDVHTFWLMDGMFRMNASIGSADDYWAWILAMDERVRLYGERRGKGRVSPTMALEAMERLTKSYSDDTQMGMNADSFVKAYFDCYRTALSYRQLLLSADSLDWGTPNEERIVDLLYSEFSSWYYITSTTQHIMLDYTYAKAHYSLSTVEINMAFGKRFKERLSYLKVEEGILSDRPVKLGRAKRSKVSPERFQELIAYFRSRDVDTVIEELDPWYETYEDAVDIMNKFFDFECLRSELDLLESSLEEWLEAREEIAKCLPENKRKVYKVVTSSMYAGFFKDLSDLKELRY